jgi:signal transduction histidine kinase
MTQRLSPDTVDTRIVFRVYAVLAFWAGIILLAPPPAWLSTTLATTPWGKLVVFRLFAAVFVAAACFAMGFGQIEDPRSRHRALLWFAVGHAVVCLVVGIQIVAFDDHDPRDLALPILLGATSVLFYFWQTGDGYRAGQFAEPTRLFDSDPNAHVQSRYEEKIREAAAQEERNRLARDLHDAVKQQVFAIHTAAATAQARFDDDPPGAQAALERVRESAREAMAEMEAMLENLRAAPLENVGLVEALKKQCEALGFRTGAQVEFRVGDLPASQVMPPDAQQALFRVAQEALANIGRHARAQRVSVALDTRDERVHLEIKDDGRGFDETTGAQGMGLRNIRARATGVGGAVNVRSRPGEGTTVHMSMPFAVPIPDISTYRRGLAMWTSNLVVVAGFVLVEWFDDRNFWMMLTLAPLAIVGFVRSLIAYQRARRQRTRSPWIASPSH